MANWNAAYSPDTRNTAILSSGDNMGGECNSKCVKVIEEAYCVYITHLCNIRENETSEGLQVFEYSEY